MTTRPLTIGMRATLRQLARDPLRWGDCSVPTQNRLRALRDRGFAECTTGSGADQLHEITPAGRAALEAWDNEHA